MQPQIPSLPSKLIYSLQLLNGNPRSKNPPLHRNNNTLVKTVSHCHTHNPKPKKIEKRTPNTGGGGGGRAHLPKAVKPGFLSWRLDAALNPKWSQSIVIIIKSQNPVFSEPKKSLIDKREILQSPEFAISNRKQTPKILSQETRDGWEVVCNEG